ncbi:MAG: hypothetical protein IJR99_06985 [Kiritimatiellae bacterium]|nr:hypothetical protein [Kiritimatiellia bacterium]
MVKIPKATPSPEKMGEIADKIQAVQSKWKNDGSVYIKMLCVCYMTAFSFNATVKAVKKLMKDRNISANGILIGFCSKEYHQGKYSGDFLEKLQSFCLEDKDDPEVSNVLERISSKWEAEKTSRREQRKAKKTVQQKVDEHIRAVIKLGAGKMSRNAFRELCDAYEQEQRHSQPTDDEQSSDSTTETSPEQPSNGEADSNSVTDETPPTENQENE